MTLPSSAILDLRGLLGDANVLLSSRDTEKYERGYRYGSGHALAIARPGTTDELVSVVRYCFRNNIKLVSQGANTGLVAASTPDSSSDQLLLSLERMRCIEAIDVHNRTARVCAGVRLSELNREASADKLFFPIDVGADPSLGGMIATNTGGARLLRYGDVQRNLLGLEVVLADADGTVLSDLKGLRKDNSGIDLKQLFVGTGGTFGVISRAQVELHPIPRQTSTAFVVPENHAVVPQLLTQLEVQAGEFLAAFEGISRNALEAALQHNPRLRNPFGSDVLPEYTVLVELTSSMRSEQVDLAELLPALLNHAMEATPALIVDARFGRPEDFWAIRHSISDAVSAAGSVIAFDIAVPRSRLPALRSDLIALLHDQYPFLRVCDFGHCGDGGDHFNLVWPRYAAPTYDPVVVNQVRALVYDCVIGKNGGSFSAEHGVGPFNQTFYRKYVSAAERSVASRLKRLFDPKALLGNVDFS